MVKNRKIRDGDRLMEDFEGRDRDKHKEIIKVEGHETFFEGCTDHSYRYFL